jgi:hypothetical protein
MSDESWIAKFGTNLFIFPTRRDRRSTAPGNLGTQPPQRPAVIVARVFVQDRRRDRPSMRPDLGLLSWPVAPPQPATPLCSK